MKGALRLVLVVFAVVVGFAAAQAQTAKKTSPAVLKKAHTPIKKTSAHTTVRHGVSSAHSRTAGTTSVKYVRNKHGKLVRVVARAQAPSYQLHPDPERYQQIQQALADKGYFKGEVNGQWGDDSQDALRRFQAAQKLDQDNGHITSLTLISLGLGPKHDHDIAAQAPAANTPATPPSAPTPPMR